jgi:hypothetical protein
MSNFPGDADSNNTNLEQPLTPKTGGDSIPPINPPSQDCNIEDDPFSAPEDQSPVQPLAPDDPFAASNFVADDEVSAPDADDFTLELGVPSDEEFCLVSSDPRHHVKATVLVVKSDSDGFGKSYFLLSPAVAIWAKQQVSLKKFIKTMHIFVYKVADGGYGLWLVRDSLDNWSISELQVVNQAKRVFTRRFTDGKARKGHPSEAIDTSDVVFPDKPLVGKDGLLAAAFGEAFVIVSNGHPVLNRLLGK